MPKVGTYQEKKVLREWPYRAMACDTRLHSADNNLRLEMAQLLLYGFGGFPALGGPGVEESSTHAEDVLVAS
jgi:hypothetical protein